MKCHAGVEFPSGKPCQKCGARFGEVCWPGINADLLELPRLREALKEAIDVFEGMHDDEISMELLPRLRTALARQTGAGAQEWQPIETAPRDGTRILAIGGGLDQMDIVVFDQMVGAWNTSSDTLDDIDDEPEGYNRPSHWQPLPAALVVTRPAGAES